MLKDALLGTLGIVLLIAVLSFYTPDKTTDEPEIFESKVYQVERIEYGDLVLVNPQDRSDNFILPMEEVFEFKLDVNATSMIQLDIDQTNEVIDVKEVEP